MTPNIVAIHQPNYFPWLGYFVKMAQSDVFVFHDDVEFTKSGPTRRVKIAANHTPDHTQWLSVPLKKHSDYALIKDLEISWETNWTRKHLSKIYESYHLCPFFKTYYPIISEWFEEVKKYTLLSEMNIFLISQIMNVLGIKKDIYLSSQLPVNGKASEYNLAIVHYLEGTHYISGKGGDKYQDDHIFEKENIGLFKLNAIKVLEKNRYLQISASDSLGLSVLDGLMNVGHEFIRERILYGTM